VLQDYDLVLGEPSDKHYVDFISLHFPADKVIEIARRLNLEEVAIKQC